MECAKFGLVVAGLLLTKAALAQDVDAGKQIAEIWCSNCHVVDSKRTKGVDAVPTFPAIARMSSTTEESLFVFLSTPHAEMPSLVFSRPQIRDVSAYILSLRNKQNP